MPRLTPDQIAKKMVENASRSTDSYKQGVLNPKRGPATAALAASEKRAEAVRKAETDRTWEKAMATVPDSYVSQRAAEVGAPRYASGVTAAKPKIENFWRKFHPILEGIEAEVQGMPDVSDSDREARMIANLRAMKKAKGTWR